MKRRPMVKWKSLMGLYENEQYWLYSCCDKFSLANLFRLSSGNLRENRLV